MVNMNKTIFTTLIILLVSPYISFGSSEYSHNNKSININPAIFAGTEFGPSLRFEYENSNWGKIIFDGSAGLILGGGDHLMIDLGVGYGHPLRYSERNSLFFNGYLTFIQLAVPVGMHAYEAGPSALFEFEYRRSWKKFSINIAPGFRYLHTFSNWGNFDHASIRLRLGIMYSFDKK